MPHSVTPKIDFCTRGGYEDASHISSSQYPNRFWMMKVLSVCLWVSS